MLLSFRVRPTCVLLVTTSVFVTLWCWQIFLRRNIARPSIRSADEIFAADGILPVFRLQVSPKDLEQLDQSPALGKTYVSAQLEFDGTDYGSIELRYKGGHSSLKRCYTPDGRWCPKMSLKLKFDHNKRLFGLKKINLNGMKKDKTKLKERISYKVFRDAGIPAPRSSWAMVEMNGASLGLFALVEQVDDVFIQQHFNESGGELYKEFWPVSHSIKFYEKNIKTNQKTATHQKALRFANQLEQSENKLETLGNWTDLDNMYLFLASAEAVGQCDGITTFYCQQADPPATCKNHNFYVYFHEAKDQFTLIPWDMDFTLHRPTPMDRVPHWTKTSPHVDCNRSHPIFDGNGFALAPGCDPILGALATDGQQRFDAAIDTLLQRAFQIDQITTEMKQYKAMIGKVAKHEVLLWHPDYSRITAFRRGWTRAVQELEDHMPFLVDHLVQRQFT